MPQMPLLNSGLNKRARAISTELPTAERTVNKTRTKQIAELGKLTADGAKLTADSAKLTADDAQGKLANPDFLSQYDLDLVKQNVLGNLGWDNLDPLIDPDKVGNKVIVSRAMATQDFAALSAWMQTAAIEDALIGSLRAGKLMTDDLTAVQIRLKGGTLDAVLADNTVLTRFSQEGLNLLPTSGVREDPRSNRGSKITPFAGDTHSAIGFHISGTGSNASRGFYMPAFGVSAESRNGRVELEAHGGFGSLQTDNCARLQLLGRTGEDNTATLRADQVTIQNVGVGTKTRVEGGLQSVDGTLLSGPLDVVGASTLNDKLTLQYDSPNALTFNVAAGINPSATLASTTISANSQSIFFHNMPGIPRYVIVQWNDGGYWRPIADGTNNFKFSVDTTTFYITNNEAVSRGVRAQLIR